MMRMEPRGIRNPKLDEMMNPELRKHRKKLEAEMDKDLTLAEKLKRKAMEKGRKY